MLAPTTKILKTTYLVLIYCFPFKAFNTKNHKQIQKVIINQHQIHFPSLHIKKLILVPQTRRGIKKDQGKKHRNVIIVVFCGKMADNLIKHGIVFDSEVLYGELDYHKVEFNIYFNCNKFYYEDRCQIQSSKPSGE